MFRLVSHHYRLSFPDAQIKGFTEAKIDKLLDVGKKLYANDFITGERKHNQHQHTPVSSGVAPTHHSCTSVVLMIMLLHCMCLRLVAVCVFKVLKRWRSETRC